MSMLETVRFQLGRCPQCGPDVLLAGDLDAAGELVPVCAHCGTLIPEGSRLRELGPSSLTRYGYVIEGEGESRGCGTEGGSCGGSCGTKH
jgi:ribosomal protein S27AE